MKKFLCAVLCLLMFASLAIMAGCTEKTPVNTQTAVSTSVVTNTETNEGGEAATVIETPSTEAPDTEIDLPDVNYGNEEFLVLSQSDGDRHYDIYCEDHEINNAVRDAVRSRNLAVEEKYGVKIVVQYDNFSSVNSTIEKMVKSNSDEYDLCFVHMVTGATLALNNNFIPFEELEYTDLSKPWWDQSLKSGFSIGNHLYMANGDISPSSFSTTSCLYFNKKLFNDYDIEPPYQLVIDGKWTIDKLIEYTKPENLDESIVGLTSWAYDVPYSLYYGAGGMLVTKDESDMPVYEPNIAKETAIYNKIYDVIISNNAYFENADYMSVGDKFINGKALFYDASLLLADRLREMNNDFGILPMPKLNETQKEYYSFVNGASSMVCVPRSCENVERASIILEALASEAYKTVTPVLYETFLKRKVTRDADSQEMIDYIVRNRVYDMGYTNLFDNIGSYVRDMLLSRSTNVSSTFEKNSKPAQSAIKKIIAAYEKRAD